MSALTDLAGKIDPRAAQLAVARACASAGAVVEWDSETIEWVMGELVKALPPGTPNPGQTCDDDEGLKFWRAVDRG